MVRGARRCAHLPDDMYRTRIAGCGGTALALRIWARPARDSRSFRGRRSGLAHRGSSKLAHDDVLGTSESEIMMYDNGAITRAAFEALTTDNDAAIEEILASDCVLHQCGIPEPIRGSEKIKHRRPGRFLAEQQVTLEQIVTEGDLAAIHWRTSGVYADPGRPDKNGQSISFMSMSFLRLEQGKIQEIWNIQDMSTVAAQLGDSG